MMQDMTETPESDLPLTDALEAAALEILDGDESARRAALDALIAAHDAFNREEFEDARHKHPWRTQLIHSRYFGFRKGAIIQRDVN